MISDSPGRIATRYRNYRRYEVSNHLGNVMSVVTDRLKGNPATLPQRVSAYEPDIVAAQDYYPFGQVMRGRNFPTLLGKSNFPTKYRYGFNDKEADTDGEIQNLTTYDYGFRIYNPGIARFLSVDPLTRSYPELTPYQFASNTPIQAIDLDGLEAKIIINKIYKVDGELKIVHSYELKPEDTHHGQVGSFKDYADQNKYGTNGTLIVNDFVDPVSLPDGVKLNKYEFLELSSWDKVKNAFMITPGDGGTQRGGVSFTDGGEGGAMETKDRALDENVNIVDIGSLLTYLNYSKGEISINASTIRQIRDPQVMAEVSDLIGDIGELTKDNNAKPTGNLLRLPVDSSCRDCARPPHDSIPYIRKDKDGVTIDTIDPKKK